MKNSVKQLLSLLLSMALVLTITSCGDDDDPIAVPSVSNPDASSVQINASVNITFSVTTAGGYAQATVQATGGTAEISSQPDAGATSGDVVVSFTGSTVGAGSVTITVTDAEGQTDDATAVITVNAVPVVSVRGNIVENTTWTASNIYVLDTRVTVLDGVTLTIEPGTVIKGNEGQQAAATALLIARGGKLMAEGTASLPIIFTSIDDPITPADIAAGNYASTTSPTQTGRWGGVIILGKAPITAQNSDGSANNLTELQIEGIPSSDPNGLYGGTDDADNSGVLSYISIRHGGTNIGSGNEINGLTLGGVGSGTSISNIEVVANADDGIEFFGGSVSVNGAVIWNSFDDSMDTDQDWNGTVSNFIIITPNTGSAFELDGPEGSRTRGTNGVFTEGVIYGGADIDAIVDWDSNTNCILTNLYFFGITAGRVDSFGGTTPAASINWETDLADNSGGFFNGVTNGVITYGVAVGSKTHGPSASDFAWTWAGNSGRLAELGL